MKIIQLNRSTIEIPDYWEDLSYKEKIFTFGILAELFAGTIAPEIARLKMLIEYTGYKPSLIQIIKELLTKSNQREIINFNLLKLSEELTFVFKVEENKIIPNHVFKTNPVNFLKIGRNKYFGKRFELDITAKTNITAREFCDCFDLLSSQQHLTSDSDREDCVNQICAILFPKCTNYTENLVSGHHRQLRFVDPRAKFGVIFWFTGIVKYYTEHPVYSVLFKHEKTDDDQCEKIRLGMNETALSLQKEGYGNPETMNLNDYFDAQIKYLKDIINKAIAEGVKPEKLSQKTGILIEIINKLT